MLVQKRSDIIRHFVAVQVLNQKFFSSSSQIRGARNFNPIFVVQALLSCEFCNAVSVIGTFVKPLMVGDHLPFQPLNIKTEKGVFVPQIHLLLRHGHLHSYAVRGDPLSSTRWTLMAVHATEKESSCHDRQGRRHGRS